MKIFQTLLIPDLFCLGLAVSFGIPRATGNSPEHGIIAQNTSAKPDAVL
jgi:hypothetical protein